MTTASTTTAQDPLQQPPISPIDRAIAAAPAAMRHQARIKTSEARQELNDCAAGTIFRYCREGKLSPPLYIGGREALWLAHEVLAIKQRGVR